MRNLNPPMGAWGLTDHKEEDMVGTQSVPHVAYMRLISRYKEDTLVRVALTVL